MGVVAGGGHTSLNFYDVICVENLIKAWQEFRKGKRSKNEVAAFELNLENNIFELHDMLVSDKWIPNPYKKFLTHDPKLRTIHKASIRDRVLYQAIYQKLYQTFDPTFIFHSYSSRNTKGTHAGIISFEKYIRKVTQNYRKPAHVLKCDVRKFFDSINHNI